MTEPISEAELSWWRRIPVDVLLTIVGWLLPGDRHFKVTYEPTEKTWSVQVLEDDSKPAADDHQQ